MEVKRVLEAARASQSTGRLPGAKRQREKLLSIEYVRALAAVAVIVWHTGWSRTVLGQSGVDAFFVVSGFVMMLVSGREATPLSFGVARFLRIVPFYWVVTLVTAAVSRPPAGLLWFSLLFWPKPLFPVVIQGWSLDLEMFYYALFAAALLAPVRWRLAALVAEFALLCVVLPQAVALSRPMAAWAEPMGLEFLAGAVLYALWSRGAIPTGARAWTLAAVSAAALAATVLYGDAPAGWMRVVLWGVPALGLVAGGLGIERAGQLPGNAVLRGLGAASYAIYLTHLLVLGVIRDPLYRLWAPEALVVAVPVCCLAGWLVHLAVERPLHVWGKALVGRGLRARHGSRRVRVAG